MSKEPGLFVDIGKKAKDILNANYTTDQKFSINTSTENELGRCGLAGLSTEDHHVINLSQQQQQWHRSIHLNRLNSGGPDLDNEELEVVKYVISKRPIAVAKTIFDRELLVQTDKTSIDREHMLSLLPGSWVSDDVINSVAHMLNSSQKKDGRWRNLYLPTWVQQFLASGTNAKDVVRSHISHWLDGRLEHCTRIYIPINDINKHWYLLVVDVADRTVYVVDTLEYGYVERRLNVIYMMLTFIQELVDMENQKFVIWKDEKLVIWGLTFPDHVPDQEQLHDGSNCGMYVIHFMIYPSELPNVTPNTVVTNKHRLFLIASLILWGKNNNKDKIKKLALEYGKDDKLGRVEGF